MRLQEKKGKSWNEWIGSRNVKYFVHGTSYLVVGNGWLGWSQMEIIIVIREWLVARWW